jgi:hypothetical protein
VLFEPNSEVEKKVAKLKIFLMEFLKDGCVPAIGAVYP